MRLRLILLTMTLALFTLNAMALLLGMIVLREQRDTIGLRTVVTTDAEAAQLTAQVQRGRQELAQQERALRAFQQEVQALESRKAVLQTQADYTVTLLANLKKFNDSQQGALAQAEQAEQARKAAAAKLAADKAATDAKPAVEPSKPVVSHPKPAPPAPAPADKLPARPRRTIAEIAGPRKYVQVHGEDYVACSFQELWELRDISPKPVSDFQPDSPAADVFRRGIEDGRVLAKEARVGDYAYPVLYLRADVFETYANRINAIHAGKLPWKITETIDDDKPEELVAVPAAPKPKVASRP